MDKNIDLHEMFSSAILTEDTGRDVTFRASRSGHFMQVSSNAEHLTGYKPSELVGMHFSGLVHTDDLDRVVKHYAHQLVSQQLLTRIDFAIGCKDGSTKYVEQTVELIGDSETDGPVFLSRVRDVTRQAVAERELEKSEDRFRVLFESSPDALLIQSLDGYILDLNPAACELHEVTRDSIIGKHNTTLAPPERREIVIERFKQLVDGTVKSLTGFSLNKHGVAIPIDIRASRITFRNQPAMLLHVRDISQRLEAEKALQISEQTNEAIVKALPDVIFWISSEGEYLHYTADSDDLLSTPRSELIGNNVKHTLPKPVYRQVMQAIRQVLSTDSLQIIRYSLEVGGNSERRYFETRVVPARDKTVLMIVRDVSYERLLEHQVVYAREAERRRIGRDLHDGLGSLLTGIAMLSRGLERDASDGKTISSEQLEQIASLAKAGVDQARALARGLNPVKLEELGLFPALEKLAADTQTISQIPVAISIEDVEDVFDNDVAMQIYWIAQEAITNAVKHANADTIEVLLRNQEDGIELIVSDDGSGMPSGEGRTEGVGLPIMNYRAQLIGARLSVEISTLGGTKVRCLIPLT